MTGGQFLLTGRIRYNESTDWWILRFKSRLFDLKRIRLCLFRSIAHWKSFQTASVPHVSCTETVAFVAESSVLLKVDHFKPQITAMKKSTCCKKKVLNLLCVKCRSIQTCAFVFCIRLLMQKYAGGGPCISEGHTDMDKDNKGCQTQNCYNEHINNIKHKNHLNVKKSNIA